MGEIINLNDLDELMENIKNPPNSVNRKEWSEIKEKLLNVKMPDISHRKAVPFHKQKSKFKWR